MAMWIIAVGAAAVSAYASISAANKHAKIAEDAAIDAEKERERQQAELDKQKAEYKQQKFENPFANMENVH